jgi:putative glutamine amidotransferase
MSDRPVIGIACDVRIDRRVLCFAFEEYVRCVEDAGGVPVLLPPLRDPARTSRALSVVDGLVIPGGEDLDPRLYGEEPLASHDPVPAARQAADLALAREVLASRLPVLGICYGCQLLAVASGGALWQDIPSQVEEALGHAGRYPDLPLHPIDVTEGSHLRDLLGAERVEVNSAHHQAPKRLGPGLLATAISPDGVIEGFEAEGDRFLLGIEWHPELMDDEANRGLFTALVEAARRYRITA